MKALGVLLVLFGMVLLIGLVVLALPSGGSSLADIETDLAAWLGMTFSIVGALFLVGGSISAAQADTFRSLNDVTLELRRLDEKIENIRVAAKHSVQEFRPKDQVAEYKGYEIYYRHRYYYVRDVNAKFFSQPGAECWIDKMIDKKSTAS